MPDDARIDPRPTGSDLDQLRDFLDLQRATLLLKTDGLDDAQLRRSLPPSSLTLAGLLRHATLNEDWWFAVRFAGQDEPEPWVSADFDADPDWEFRTALDLPGDELRAAYAAACSRSDAIIAAAGDPDALAARTSRDGIRWNLRWIVLHMIEETARHAGHADLIRESVDGSVGE